MLGMRTAINIRIPPAFRKVKFSYLNWKKSKTRSVINTQYSGESMNATRPSNSALLVQFLPPLRFYQPLQLTNIEWPSSRYRTTARNQPHHASTGSLGKFLRYRLMQTFPPPRIIRTMTRAFFKDNSLQPTLPWIISRKLSNVTF